MAPAGQRRLALVIALATTVLAAGAIFFLHRSMPVPVPDAPARAAAGKPSPTVTAEDNAGPQPRAVQPDTPSPLTRESGAPVSLRVPMPESDSRGGRPEGQAMEGGARHERATGPAVPSAAVNRAASGNGARQTDKPTAQTRKRTPGDTTGTSPQTRSGSADAGASPTVVPAPAATPAPTPAAAAAPSPPQRLAGEQQVQCAGSEFISRFICNERVRLRFCRDRWNEHPDCRVETTTGNH